MINYIDALSIALTILLVIMALSIIGMVTLPNHWLFRKPPKKD